MLFDVVEKSADQAGIKVRQIETRGRLTESSLRKLEEETKGVAIGSNRVRADMPLLSQTLEEEPLEQSGKRGCGAHERSSHRFSTRRAAAAISSGHADRYQYVFWTLQWPRYVLRVGR